MDVILVAAHVMPLFAHVPPRSAHVTPFAARITPFAARITPSAADGILFAAAVIPFAAAVILPPGRVMARDGAARSCTMVVMTFIPSPPLPLAAFVAVLVGVLGLLHLGVFFAYAPVLGRAGAARRAGVVALGVGLWLALLALVVRSGALAAAPMPGIPLFFLASNGAGLILALSPLGARLAFGLPLGALVAFQGFRLPLELVLHAWAEHGTIPGTMTWTGQNLDILSGVAALALAPFASRRAAAWLANLLGAALLINVARVAILSSPLPFAWAVQPKLLLAAHLPYALIAPVCVAGALAGHVILTRRLLQRAP